MTQDEVFCNTFKALEKRIDHDAIKHQVEFMLPSMPMVNACRANDFAFFYPLIDSGDLTISQMQHAADRYHLGKSKSGLPIFWMIDDMLQPLDAHLGNTWISSTLKSREPLLQYWNAKHCLFGLHLLTQGGSINKPQAGPLMVPAYLNVRATGGAVASSPYRGRPWRGWMSLGSFSAPENEQLDHVGASPFDKSMPISIVESEQSAVILSELLPEALWMSYSYTGNLTVDLLEPLQGHTVTIYPRTDPTMSNYVFFLEYADLVRRTYPSIHLSIDTTLEDRASPSQKSQCIDLLDFLLEE